MQDTNSFLFSQLNAVDYLIMIKLRLVPHFFFYQKQKVRCIKQFFLKRYKVRKRFPYLKIGVYKTNAKGESHKPLTTLVVELKEELP